MEQRPFLRSFLWKSGMKLRKNEQNEIKSGMKEEWNEIKRVKKEIHTSIF